MRHAVSSWVWTTLSSRKVTVLLALSAIVLFYLRALPNHNAIDFVAYNGKFQTYNAAARVLSGQIPGADFQAYLGIGPAYVAAMATLLGGGNFYGSIVGNEFIHKLVAWFCIFVIYRSLGIRKSAAVSLSLLCLLGFLTVQIVLDDFSSRIPISRYFSTWAVAAWPFNSDYGLRMAPPFIFAALVMSVCASAKLSGNALLRRIGYMALCAGWLPYWSNDGGVAAFAASGAVAMAVIHKNRPHITSLLGYMMLYYALLFIAAGIWGVFLTAGNLAQWIDYTFAGVAAEQRWYFFTKEFYQYYINFNSLPYAIGLIAALLGVSLHFRWKYSQTYYLYFYLVLSTLVSAIIPYVGYAGDFRYFTAAGLVCFASFFILAFQAVPWKKNPIISASVGLSFIVSSFIYFGSRGDNVVSVFIRPEFAKWERHPLPELNGDLRIQFDSAVEWARRIRGETTHLPADSRIVSNYASMIDHVAGAQNPSGFDYLIHVHGEKARQDYLAALEDKKPPYATTLRIDYTRFGWWAWRRDWWFFSTLIKDYEPVAATFYNVIWRRRDAPLRLTGQSHNCTIERRNGAWILGMPTALAEITTMPSFGTISLLTVTFDSAAKQGTTLLGTPKIFLTDWRKVRGAARHSNKDYSISIDPENRTIEFPVIQEVGRPNFVLLETSDDQVLTVTSCRWVPVLPLAATGKIRVVPVSYYSDDRRWERGVAVRSVRYNAILIDDPDDRTWPLLFEGEFVMLADGKVREIKAAYGRRILVDGPPIEPEIVGYPNKIMVLLR